MDGMEVVVGAPSLERSGRWSGECSSGHGVEVSVVPAVGVVTIWFGGSEFGCRRQRRRDRTGLREGQF